MKNKKAIFLYQIDIDDDEAMFGKNKNILKLSIPTPTKKELHTASINFFKNKDAVFHEFTLKEFRVPKINELVISCSNLSIIQIKNHWSFPMWIIK